jgi:uncharacterized protein (TIGR01777 family)
MRFLLVGASGFLGSAWCEHLRGQDHQVTRLVRRTPAAADEIGWDPGAGRVDMAAVESADVVACLSGAPLAHWPWTAGYQQTFTDSRVRPTRTLAEAVAASDRKPALLAQNGIAGYGDQGDVVLTEDSPTDADTFMAEVTRRWQAATEPAAGAGARVVVMRTAVVLDRHGGALRPMLLAFRAGLGGPIGSGRQYFSTISLADWVRAATHLATGSGCTGVYNLAAPEQATNAEFTRELAKRLHRPAPFRVPEAALRVLARPVASEVLGSARVEPARLLAEGFHFEHPTLHSRIAAALG